ncbi:hypothetical protein [Kitasatospora aureofaciens]|uniref:hypothetical protein n=1 Tax=Kitasatospora aureofaciens TaxID=1894 RepID=UPI0036F48F25
MPAPRLRGDVRRRAAARRRPHLEAPHVSQGFAPLVDEAAQALDQVAAFINGHVQSDRRETGVSEVSELPCT